MKRTERVEFDATLPGDPDEVCIGFDRTTEWAGGMEGADADGRRGQWQVDIVVDDYAHITVDGAPCLTLNAMKAVEAYMQAHIPDMPEMPEPDFDDEGD